MTGYDADFLGLGVPLPVPPGEVRVLHYTHFSVLLDPVRRLAAATVCAVDGAALLALPRSGRWRLDDRVAAGEQAGAELYARNPLDRGHLVRRLDPVWGDAETAARANRDTFRYPNAAPQVNRFNQSKELWNGLEDHVLAYAAAYDHRIVVQTGPVFGADDPPYRGVRIPRLFWKVVAWVGPGDVLRSTAFVLDQTPQLDDARLSEITAQALARDDIPPLGPFRTYQVPVPDVAALTRLDLGPLPRADVLAGPHVTPAGSRPTDITVQRLPRARAWSEIRTPAEITLP
ncbi:DNA/RNA non-specific endonuclease [Promicromonospora thailandica]|uniref:DNA/RNA non-specific endonuclease n=1 Tax=Promicromonospora thailandica TaxID=765201 RepID=UPI0020A2C9E4|nr:DNA/RNA non-specific endonuclease [Promicromonospora thailandica]